MKQAFFKQLPKDLWDHGPVVVGVSGGADSVALLLLLLNEISGERQDPRSDSVNHQKIVVAHFDHRWREESAAEAKWVESLAREKEIEFVLGQASPPAKRSNTSRLGLEGLARSERYQFFRQTLENLDAKYLLTGHHKDDQIETILMRILRGTSVTGLAGIPPQRDLSDLCQVLRPLLPFSRLEIEEYLKTTGTEFLTDPSNMVSDRTRNRVRHQLIPFLTDQFGDSCLDAIERLGENARDSEHILSKYEESFEESVLICNEGRLEINVKTLPKDRPLVKRLLRRWWAKAGFGQREMSRDHWERLTNLVVPDPDVQPWPANCQFPGPIFASRSKGCMFVGYEKREPQE